MAISNVLDVTTSTVLPSNRSAFSLVANRNKKYSELRNEILQETGGAVDLNEIGAADRADVQNALHKIQALEVNTPTGKKIVSKSQRNTQPFVFSFQNFGTQFPGPARFYNRVGNNLKANIKYHRFVLPVPPSDFQVSVPNNQNVINTISGFQYTHAGNIELDEISWSGVFPFLEGVESQWPKYIPEWLQRNGHVKRYRPPSRWIAELTTAMRANQPLIFAVYAVDEQNRLLTSSDRSAIIKPLIVSVSSFDWNMGTSVGGHRQDVEYNITLKRWRRQSICIGNFVTRPNRTDKEPHERPDNAQVTKYTVKRGDYLIRIAQRLLGNGNRWREIYDLNRKLIGPNPNLIFPGQVLKIPKK